MVYSRSFLAVRWLRLILLRPQKLLEGEEIEEMEHGVVGVGQVQSAAPVCLLQHIQHLEKCLSHNEHGECSRVSEMRKDC